MGWMGGPQPRRYRHQQEIKKKTGGRGRRARGLTCVYSCVLVLIHARVGRGKERDEHAVCVCVGGVLDDSISA